LREQNRSGFPLKKVSLLSRWFHLGIARISFIGSRAILFLCFGYILNPKDYGLIALLLSIGAIASLVLEMGIGTAVLKRSAQNEDETAKSLGGILLMRIVALLPVLGLFIAASRLVLKDDFQFDLALAAGLYTLVYQIGQTFFSFMRGIRETEAERNLTTILHLLETLAVGIFWYIGNPLHLVLLMTVLAGSRCLFIAGLIVWILNRYRAVFRLAAFTQFFADNKAFIAAFALLSVCQFAYIQADVLLLKIYRTTEEVGRYWACYRLIAVLFLPVDIFVAAVMPRLAAARSNINCSDIYKGMHLICMMWVLPLLIVLFFYRSELVCLLLGKQFGGVEPLMLIIGIGLGLAYLPPYGLGLSMTERPWSLVLVSSIAAMANVLLNLWMIPIWGATGAAWATVCSYGILKLSFLIIMKLRRLSILAKEALIPTTFAVMWSTFCCLYTIHLAVTVSVLVFAAGTWMLMRGRIYMSWIEGDGILSAGDRCD
jgi:O-antigen/teichoic acid export membrane protein